MIPLTEEIDKNWTKQNQITQNQELQRQIQITEIWTF